VKLALAVPAYRAIEFACARSIWETTACLSAMGVDYVEIMHLGDPDLARARNAILGAFLRGAADRLLFVDSDQVFNFDGAWRLISSEAAYVGANYPQKRIRGGMASTPKVGGRASGSLIEAEMLATGFLSLSRSAVERLAAVSPKYRSDDGHNIAAITASGPVNGQWMSEDETMVRRWQSLGEVAWIDTAVQCDHVGLHCFTRDSA
jgi:hypothetical protein